MTSFGEKLDDHKGFGPGFDFCRVFLALSVLLWHAIPIVVEPIADYLAPRPFIWMLRFFILPMFFGLSGFLVAASAQRLTLKNFLINRSLRILPALSVEVILSAFVLGPLLTTLPLHSYFHQREVFHYLLNIIGRIHYNLPGVFRNNPYAGMVNGSLWTIPFEMACYALISILIYNKAANGQWSLLVVAIGCLFVKRGDEGLALIPCFLIGIAMYNARYRIPYQMKTFLATVMAIIGIGVVGNNSWAWNPVVNIIVDPLFVYVVIFVGLSAIPKIPLYSTGDYSYGIYLYAFPIQQALMQLLPKIGFLAHLILSIFVVTLFAAFSWHVIEKPILRMRKNFAFIARKAEYSL
jgi:peptidoglycan/LPS O-acetylase OafA/YrhL